MLNVVSSSEWKERKWFSNKSLRGCIYSAHLSVQPGLDASGFRFLKSFLTVDCHSKCQTNVFVNDVDNMGIRFKNNSIVTWWRTKVILSNTLSHEISTDHSCVCFTLQNLTSVRFLIATLQTVLLVKLARIYKI